MTCVAKQKGKTVTQIFDRTFLDDLNSFMSPAEITEYIEMLEPNIMSRLALLDKYLAEDDYHNMQITSHALAGVGCGYGLSALKRLSKMLEYNEDATTFHRLYASVMREIHNIIQPSIDAVHDWHKSYKNNLDLEVDKF